MILAAGLGTRLRPHTLRRPKPLFPILDRPLLLGIIADLRRAGYRRIVVNAFHLREQIASLLAGATDLEVQLEERELGTGGGLRLARPRFTAEPVLVVNGDIWHDIDYCAVMAQHLAAGNDATLVLHDQPRFNKVLLTPDLAVRSFAATDADLAGAGEGARLRAFTGIQVVDPALLDLIPEGRFYHSIDWYQQLISLGYRVQAMVAVNHCWTDMGTPADYLDLHARLLGFGAKGGGKPTQVGAGPGFVPPGAAPFFLGNQVRREAGVEFADWVVVGSRAVLARGVKLRRCVVWDHVEVPAGTIAEDTIFSG